MGQPIAGSNPALSAISPGAANWRAALASAEPVANAELRLARLAAAPRRRRAPRPRRGGCPLTSLIRRGRFACWASWMTVPAAPSIGFGTAKTSASTSLSSSAPTHIGARLERGEDRGLGEAGGAELPGGLAQRDDHGVGRRVVRLLDSVVRPRDHRIAGRRRPRRSAVRRGPARVAPPRGPRP